ncbi:MAG: insulinase family protein [Deltaproteobacteria bacterium]|nr:insulinase family protein [Deltaproteobacteria bacterium]
MRKRHRCGILFLWVLGILCFSSIASGIDLKKKIIRTKLKNGITVLMLERHVSPTVSLYIRHRIGAFDEAKGESGAAHLLEHMMFKGTKTIGAKNYAAEKRMLDAVERTGDALDRERKKGPEADDNILRDLTAQLKKLQEETKQYYIPNEIDRLYTGNGGLDMNASTGHDLTTYKISLPANYIELWARIEADRMQNPVFRDFYTERDVVMEERRQRVESSPTGKFHEQFMKTAYQVHPYGRPVLGWPDDLMRLSPAVIRNFFQKYQDRRKTVIAVVGAIKPRETLKLLEKYFGCLPSRNEAPKVDPVEPVQMEERRVEVFFKASPMMMIGFHKPAAPAYHDYVFDVLETMLTRGRTSRLYSLMVTKMQIAESVGAVNGAPAMMHPNLFTISARPRHPHTNAELEETILKEIEKIKTQPISDLEIAKAKNLLKMEFLRGFDSDQKIASNISYYECIMGDYRYIFNYLNIIDIVSAEAIKEAAQIYLTKENRIVGVLTEKKD